MGREGGRVGGGERAPRVPCFLLGSVVLLSTVFPYGVLLPIAIGRDRDAGRRYVDHYSKEWLW